MTGFAIAVAAVGTIVAAPAAAHAAVICVPAAVAGCDGAAATPQAAADAATEGDTIRIAAGEHPGVSTDKRLTFVGEGAGTVESAAGATVLTGDSPSAAGLNLVHGGVVRQLRVQGAAGSDTARPGAGLHMFVDDPSNHDLTLDEVIVRGGAAAGKWGGAIGVNIFHLSGGGGNAVPALNVRGGAILGGDGEAYVTTPPPYPDQPPGLEAPGLAFSPFGRDFRATIQGTLIRGGAWRSQPGRRSGGVSLYGGSFVFDRATVEGDIALQSAHAALSVVNSTLGGDWAGLYISPGGAVMGPVEVVNSLVTAVPRGGQKGIAAAYVSGPEPGAARFLARGSTFFARGNVDAGLAFAPNPSSGAGGSATLRNTLALAEGTTSPTAADLLVDGWSVDAAFSAYRTYRLAHGGVAPAPGSGTNVGSTAALVDPQLMPLPGSPLVDAGDAGLVQPGEVDRLGNPRSVDGNGDCVARPDIGAFERPAVSCNPAPVVSKFGMTKRRFAPVRRRGRRADAARRVPRGSAFRFQVSEPAGVRIALRRVSKGRRVKVRGKLRCVAPKRRHRRAPRCLRVRRVGTLNVTATTGANRVRFTGRMKGRAFRPGRYRATIVARDDQGAASRPSSLRFRIVRP